MASCNGLFKAEDLSDKCSTKSFHFTDEDDLIMMDFSSSDESEGSNTEDVHVCKNEKCLNVTISEVLNPSYGMYVWPCSPVLAQFIWHYRVKLKGKTILELGAGTALPSVVAAKCGATPPPLQLKDQLNDIEKNSLLYRRLSRGGTISYPKSSACSNETSSIKDVARSQSMRSTRKNNIDLRRRHRGSSIPSEVTSSGSTKVQQRTVSNRSLPLPGDETDYTRLRNFSVTSKGVINRGDSFRSKTSANFASIANFARENVQKKPPTPEAEDTELSTTVYKVLLVGSHDVGKTSLKNQFMTSEYICASEGNYEENHKAVTVVLNAEESQLEFQEETLTDKNINYVNNYQPDAFVVVYSVASRGSFLLAKHLLCQIDHNVDHKTIILVANKTDLARLRMVTTEDGRALAKVHGCKFIETSVAINHQVDELLVGTLTQIRMKSRLVEKRKSKKKRDSQTRKSSIYTGSKASGVLKKILQRACLKSKSCDNLHVL